MKNTEKLLEDVRPLVEVRKFLYDVLRRTYLKEPTQGDIKFVKELVSSDEFPFVSDSPKILEGINQVRDYCSQSDMTSDKVYSDLHWDYTRLFIGPYELPSPPWESVYLNKERLLFQEDTLKVRRFYLKYSFLPVEFGHEADDHLGLELDFMFRLNELALEAMGRGDSNETLQLLKDQRLFLEEHLLKWAPQFVEKVLEHADTDYYRGMAKILEGFLTLDNVALDELIRCLICEAIEQ